LKLDIQTMKISGLSAKGQKTIDILNLSINAKDFRLDKKYFKGAINCRIKIKANLDKALSIKKKHKEKLPINYLFDEIIALIELIDIKKENTSTYASYLLNNKIFNELVDYIKREDKFKYSTIVELIKMKSIYCLTIN